jgi:hypothetical protein
MTDLVRPDQIEGYSPNLTNLIVNGDFEIWQRGSGPFVSPLFTADEWYAYGKIGGSDVVTVSRATGAKFGNYCLQSVYAIGGVEGQIQQGVEGWKSLIGFPITFSVWVKTSTAGVSVDIVYNMIDGTHGASGPTASHSGSGEWELLTAVLNPVPAGVLATPGLPHNTGIACMVISSQSGTALIDGASLVVGRFPYGVDFNPVSPAEDWTRCQRYYTKMTGMQFDRSMNVAGISRETQPFQQAMAAVPALTISNLVTVPPLSTVTAIPLDTLMWKLELGIGPNPVGPFNYTFDFEAEVA